MGGDIDIPPLDLLHGSLSLGAVAARAICDAVPLPKGEEDERDVSSRHEDRSQTNICNGEDIESPRRRTVWVLPDLMNDLCTRYLVHTSWTTRQNAASLLELLCARFRTQILREISKGARALSIMSLTEIDMDSILATNKPLYSSDVGMTSSSDFDIRDPNWLLSQRRELRRRLLRESDVSSDEKTALRKSDVEAGVYQDIVTDEDLKPPVISKDSSDSTQAGMIATLRERRTNNGAYIVSSSAVSSDSSDGRESWAAVLLHFLVLGIVDTNWETRQGCALGLSRMISALFGNRKESSNTAADLSMPSGTEIILENVVCSGLCCLMLDRFIDCSGGSTSVALVNEVVAQCVSIATTYLSDGAAYKVFKTALKMTSFSKDWMVRNAGFILLKYFTPLWLRSNSDVASDNLMGLFDSIKRGIADPSDDTTAAAAHTIMSIGLASIIRVSLELRVQIDSVIDAIYERLSLTEVFSAAASRFICIIDVLSAVTSLASMLVSSSTSTSESSYSTIITTLLNCASKGLHISVSQSVSVRLKCYAEIEKLLRSITRLVGSNGRECDDSLRQHLFNLILDVIICAPCVSDQLSIRDEAKALTSFATCGSVVRCDDNCQKFSSCFSEIIRQILSCLLFIQRGTNEATISDILTFLSGLYSTASAGSNENFQQDKGEIGCFPSPAIEYLRAEYGAKSSIDLAKCKNDFQIAVSIVSVLNPNLRGSDSASHILKGIWVVFEVLFDSIESVTNAAAHANRIFELASQELESCLRLLDETASSSQSLKGEGPPLKKIKVRIGSSSSQSSDVTKMASRKSAQELVVVDENMVRLEQAAAMWTFALMFKLRMQVRSIESISIDISSSLLSALHIKDRSSQNKRSRFIAGIRNNCVAMIQAVKSDNIWKELIVLATQISADVQRAFDLSLIQDILSLTVWRNAEVYSIVCELLRSVNTVELGATIMYKSMKTVDNTSRIDAALSATSSYGEHEASNLFICSALSRLTEDEISKKISKPLMARTSIYSFIDLLSATSSDDLYQNLIASTPSEGIADELPRIAISEIIRVLKHLDYDSDVQSILAELIESIRSTSVSRTIENRVKATYVAMICIVQVFQGNVVVDVNDICYAALEGMNSIDKTTRSLALELLRQISPLLPASKHNPSSLSASTIDALNSTSSLLRGLQEFTANGAYASHQSSTRTLREYQWHGVKWITQLWRYGFGGGILTDEMGLGKSIQAIAAVLVRKLENPHIVLPHIVVCPSALTHHWLREIENTVATDVFKGLLLRDVLINGRADEPLNNVILIATYNEVRRNIREIKERWRFDAIILDESHLIRNPDTATAQAIFSLPSNRRLALTGTPVQNQVEDLWSICNFILPDYLGDSKAFYQRTVKPVRRYFRCLDMIQNRKNVRNQATQNSKADPVHTGKFGMDQLYSEGLKSLQKLHEQILPFILRRTKLDVLPELPPKTIIDVYCPLTQLQRSMYEKFQSRLDVTDESLQQAVQLREGTLEESLAYKGDPSVSRSFQTINYLKLLSVHPALVVDKHMHPEYYRRLLTDVSCSGKMLSFARLLLDTGVCAAEDTTKCLLSILERSEMDAEGLSIEKSIYDVPTEARFEVVERNGKKMPVYKKPSTEAQPSSLSVSSSTNRGEKSGTVSDESDDECGISDTKESKDRRQPINSSRSNKCIVFAQHRTVLEAIEECVLKSGFPDVKYERIDGSVPMSRRFEIIEEFSGNSQASSEAESSDNIRILLMTTRSCGLGLNLSAADTVIFVENDWNPFVDLQAMDRAHRIGQIHPVSVYRMIAESTIEARIMTLRDRKEDVAAQIVNESNAGENGGGRTMQTVVANVVSNSNSNSNSNASGISTSSKRSSGHIEDGVSALLDDEVDDDPSYYDCFDVANFLRSVS